MGHKDWGRSLAFISRLERGSWPRHPQIRTGFKEKNVVRVGVAHVNELYTVPAMRTFQPNRTDYPLMTPPN